MHNGRFAKKASVVVMDYGLNEAHSPVSTHMIEEFYGKEKRTKLAS